MEPPLKYWIFILGIACAIVGVILASVFGSWLNLEFTEQAYLAGLTDRILPFARERRRWGHACLI